MDHRRRILDPQGQMGDDDAEEFDREVAGFGVRKPFGAFSDEIDDEADDAGRLVGDADDAETADLDASGDDRHRADDETAAGRFERHPVVADERGMEMEAPRLGEEFEGEARFAGPRRPAQHHGSGPEEKGGGVDRGLGLSQGRLPEATR